ncbi:MAG: CvpA family protein [Prevotellaceae bacterium]|jgi:membrane protein required for colicin V production|nr:CvpA family protein [Prevotellaceae bacterium]
MSNIDYILLAPIVFGMLYGAYRGFVKEIVAFCCVIAGIYAARYFGEIVAVFLVKILSISDQTAKGTGCALVFLAVVIGLHFVAVVVTKLLKAISLGWLNRLLGLFFGGLKWLLIVSIILNIITFFYQKVPVKKENKLSKSRFYKPIESVVPTIVPLIDFENFKEKK